MSVDRNRHLDGGADRSGRRTERNGYTIEFAALVFRALVALGINRAEAERAARRMVTGRGAQ